MTTKKPHWTQTPEGKERMSRLQTEAHARVRQAKSEQKKEVRVKSSDSTKTTILVINGWRVILSKNEVRIEN
jgi:hypothetical protein